MKLALAIAAAAAGVIMWTPVTPAQSATASCWNTPAALAVFEGTVTYTDHNGRRARVNTTDGRSVTVIGTPELSSTITSVDRDYEVGGRYVFYTLNDSHPYLDNQCTRTRKLSDGDPSPGVPVGWTAIAILVLCSLLGALQIVRSA